MMNYLGQFECKLCLTTHISELNYLAHTQGRRHKYNLAKRAYQENQDKTTPVVAKEKPIIPKTVKIGRPGYTCNKQYDPATDQYSLLIQIDYSLLKDNAQPRYRVMSAYEHHQSEGAKNFQFDIFNIFIYLYMYIIIIIYILLFFLII